MLASIVGNVPHKSRRCRLRQSAHAPSGLHLPTSTLPQTPLPASPPTAPARHHLDNCASPLAIRNIGLGDDGAAILERPRLPSDLLQKPATRVPSAPSSSYQRDPRPRESPQPRGMLPRHQRHQHRSSIQIGYSTGKSRLDVRPVELPTQPRRPMDGEPPPQPSQRLHG